MNQKGIIQCCKDLGCCDACCLRFLGLKNPSAYENARQFVHKISEATHNPAKDLETKPSDCEPSADPPKEQNSDLNAGDAADSVIDGADTAESAGDAADSAGDVADTLDNSDDSGATPAKKPKTDNVCVSCIGVLQEENWPQCYTIIKEVLDKKQYECESFACALSAPIATILRERWVALHIKEAFPEYDDTSLTPLKEAWKWSFGGGLQARVGKALHSGASSPLLVTLTMEYPDDLQELEVLKQVAPAQFAARSRQRRRFGALVTRRAAEQALAGAALARLRAAGWRAAPPLRARARPLGAAAAHAPLWLGGRYVKRSRALPQTPWLVAGRRMMHSSVQEIICEPIAALYGLAPEDAEHRLKFMSAGREDVDVRCLGDGRPFAVEITDPNREPSEAELSELCEQISASGQVIVSRLTPVSREELALLKKGEETKCKTYEALCIKLSHSLHEQPAQADRPVAVTQRDLDNINSYCDSGAGGVRLQQRTPIRVLHRRPLLTRTRTIHELRARAVPGHPALFVVRVVAQAGTYVKEWAHGELGRTRPRLADALRARADILALDVRAVHLRWPAAAAAAEP